MMKPAPAPDEGVFFRQGYEYFSRESRCQRGGNFGVESLVQSGGGQERKAVSPAMEIGMTGEFQIEFRENYFYHYLL